MIVSIFSTYKRKGFSAFGLGLLLVCSTESICVASEQPVQVQVSIKPLKGNDALYSYCVTNYGKAEIMTLGIGVTTKSPNEGGFFNTYEIKSLPIGSHSVNGIKKNSRSPKGWEISLMTQEDADEVYIDWSVKKAASHGIAPQTSLCGFEVSVPNDDKAYSEGHWSVIFDDGTPSTMGLLSKSDKPK